MKYLETADVSLREDIIQGLRRVGGKYCLKNIILFGSRARGTNHDRSDIDIAFCENNVARFLEITEEIEKIPTLLIFDIVNQAGNSYSDVLHQEIERDGVIIYGEI